MQLKKPLAGGPDRGDHCAPISWLLQLKWSENTTDLQSCQRAAIGNALLCDLLEQMMVEMSLNMNEITYIYVFLHSHD